MRWSFLLLLPLVGCAERALERGYGSPDANDLSVYDGAAADAATSVDAMLDAAIVDAAVDLLLPEDAATVFDLAGTDAAIPPGLAWRPIASGTTQKLHTVWASSANDVWVVGYAFLHGTGDPISFSTVSVPGHGFGIWGTGPQDFWVAGRYVSGNALAGVVFEGTGDPTTFTNTPALDTWGLYTLWAQGPESIWAAGDSGIVVHGQGAPMSWSTVAFDAYGYPSNTMHLPSGFGGCRQVFSMWGTGNELWAVGSAEGIMHGGADPSAWVLEHSGMGSGACSSGDIDYYWSFDLRGIWGASATDLWAVGHDGLILHGTGGGSWTKVASGTTATLTGIWGASATDLWAVGVNGTILHGTGSPITWTAVSSGTTNNLNGVWGRGAKDIWAVGSYGTILHYSLQ